MDIFLGQDDDEDDSSEEGNGNGNGNGVDPVQEYVKKRWNLNASFREDRSSDRLRPETFDLINSRYLAEGINTNRWSSYVRELRQLLKRGGWLQMVEIQFPFQSSNGTLPDDSYLTRWWQWYSYALQRMGKNVRVGQTLAEIMTTEGFQHVRPVMRDLPVGDWSSGWYLSRCLSSIVAELHVDPPNIGPGNLLIADRLLQSLSLYPFLQGEQMSQDAYRTLVNGARAELRNPAYRLYYRMCVLLLYFILAKAEFVQICCRRPTTPMITFDRFFRANRMMSC